MNDFRLQTAIQMKNGHLSLHPAASTLKTMIPKDLVRDPDIIDNSIVESVDQADNLPNKKMQMKPKGVNIDQALQLPALTIEPANEVNKDDTDMQDSESDDEGDFELHTVNTTSSEVCI